MRNILSKKSMIKSLFFPGYNPEVKNFQGKNIMQRKQTS